MKGEWQMWMNTFPSEELVFIQKPGWGWICIEILAWLSGLALWKLAAAASETTQSHCLLTLCLLALGPEASSQP